MNEGKFTLKPNLLPYRCSDDSRFKWLIEHFLGFFKDWEASIQKKQGEFSQTEKSKMLIFWQSNEGLKRTCYSVINVTRFLLENKVECVLKESLSGHFGGSILAIKTVKETNKETNKAVCEFKLNILFVFSEWFGHLKSPKELQNSGILKLPRMSTLRDYKYLIISKSGFPSD